MYELNILKGGSKTAQSRKVKSSWLTVLLATASIFCLLVASKVSVYLLTSGFFHMAGLQPNLEMYSNWDAGFYVGIAERGYYSLATFAWPPLFPLLIRGLNVITSDFVLAGLLASNIFSLLQIIPAYKLFKHYTNRPKEQVILWAIFPLYFIWGIIPYTEHVFSFFVLCTWWALKEDRKFLAIVMGILAGLTKQAGILLFIPLLLYFGNEERGVFSKIRYSIASLLIPLGTLGWHLYAGWLAGDPLAVVHAQKHFGTYFVTDLIGKLDIKFLIESYSLYTYPNHVVIPFLATFILLACLLFIPRIHRMDRYLSIYSILSIGLFIITLPLTSTLRFISTLFPLFLVVGFRVNLKLYVPICILSSSLMLFAYMQSVFIG